MRQYEQDLAKRLYQARVRGSQPAAHLRSEDQTHGIVEVCCLAFFLPLELILLGRTTPSPSEMCFLHLSGAKLLFFFSFFARPIFFSFSFLPASSGFLCFSSLSHPAPLFATCSSSVYGSPFNLY